MMDTQSAIAAAAVRCLGPSRAFDPDVPFSLLGLDSLGTIEMAAALEEALGCEVPPDLLLECRDGRALAARISALRAGHPDAEPLAAYGRMLDDAVLPADIRPPARGIRTTDLRNARRILLTGATGFLGRAILSELLDSTPAELVCLVRSAGAPRGGPSSRVRVVAGDLAHPRLGLRHQEFTALADGVDAVVHCAAAVNWIYTYSALRGVNVAGTLELLRLAVEAGAAFHFVSSLSVCYSTDGPPDVDERFDPLPFVSGVHLGYAQTKVVAESLVREAHARGLAARIYRPPLITGHSQTGEYNPDDLVTALVRGCVQMGTAPDLDWRLDCVPVDEAARSIVALSAEAGPVFHVGPERPRHWRECVLALRLHGYPLRLVPYHAWLRQLERDASDAAHPLRPLRALFVEPRASGLTLPELYEEPRRTQATRRPTSAQLDAGLLDLYVRTMRSRGDLPALTSGGSEARDVADRAGKREDLIPLASEHSIIGELTAWRSGRAVGLFRRAGRPGALVKINAKDTDVIAVGQALADVVDPAIGRVYAPFGGQLGITACHLREPAIYRQQDPRFTAHAPKLLESHADADGSAWAITIEDVHDATHVDTAGDPSAWGPLSIGSVIDGLAALQAIWFDRETELCRQPWIGYVQSSDGMAQMTALWTALASHAAPRFTAWTGEDFNTLFPRLVRGIPAWSPLLQRSPRTLIHHDFNPRNLCLRRNGRLCAYDWELATVGAPQRDLAEFLCFVLQPASAGDAYHWVDRHRTALEHETGATIEPAVWTEGFRAALYDLLINRLATYALIDRVRRQPFLGRVVRTWRALYELFPHEEVA